MSLRVQLRATGVLWGARRLRVPSRVALLAALATCFALGACHSRPDVLYMTAGPPYVALDQQRGAWHLLVDGKDVTERSDLKVIPAGQGKQLSFSVWVAQGTAGLPQAFQLEHHVDGILYCPQCAAAQRIWRRVEPGKPVQG